MRACVRARALPLQRASMRPPVAHLVLFRGVLSHLSHVLCHCVHSCTLLNTVVAAASSPVLRCDCLEFYSQILG